MVKENLVISGFPLVGKTHFSDHYISVCDSDSSKFSKDANWPRNYINHIQTQLKTNAFVLVSTHIDIRNAMDRVGIKYVVVYPDRSLKQDWLDRYDARTYNGFPKSMLEDYWDKWIDDLEKSSYRIVLQKGEYLSDRKFDLYSVYNSFIKEVFK